MTNEAVNLTHVIARLAGVIEKERKALLERAFERLSSLSREKSDLLVEFEQASSAFDDIDSLDDISRALTQIKRQAAENAAQLRALAKGVESARETLRKIRERDAETGAYARDGASLRSNSRHTISTQI